VLNIILGFFGGVIALAAALLGIYCIALITAPKAKPYTGPKPPNPYIVGNGRLLISAHRSGAGLSPEDTLMAFQECVRLCDKFTVDVFEFDLHMTADGRLILLHDDTLDRTSDSEKVFGKQGVAAREKTYDELRLLNFGANFEDPDRPGEYPYRDLDPVPDNLKALAVEDLLDYLEAEGKGAFRYVIDIKNGGEDGKRGVDMLVEILRERGLLERTIFGTFHNEVTQYVDERHPELPRSAGKNETIFFFLRSLVNLPQRKDIKYIALQVPDRLYKYIILDTKRFVRYCHKYNLSVQYWTVNEAAQVRKLIDYGADLIFSDYPDMVHEVVSGQ